MIGRNGYDRQTWMPNNALHLCRKPAKSILPWSMPPRRTDRLDEQPKTASE
ncbi:MULTISPECIES: hypothetical protein [Bacteroides]|uniref:Uncharacterized protein n=1 Tax=Bacteroides zhangwenhongii TaxID=2650157 RepID=A0ABT5H956_9BACE|nr:MULTISPECIES: hypothetical protein [Bacteroides]MCL1626987.1 hypothetical protein [Bacteroides caecicola]MDC7137119.1 hypothetical protein [Bacteroides zhangwenhongii]